MTFPQDDGFEDRLLSALSEPVPQLRIGWGGVITTHPDDLQVLSRALGPAGVEDFTIVGPVPDDSWGGAQRAKRLLGLKPRFTGSITFADYLPVLQRSLDVGLAPLEANTFNESKSWLKPLEYAACGIPVLHSAHEEYDLLGVGLPVEDDHRAWKTALKRITTSSALRDELRHEGYEIARANTYALHQDEWFDALSVLL